MTEDEIRAVTVGEPTLVDGPITVAEYDPGWPRTFALEEERLRSVLGSRALAIEHVGSTSVPGLAAKPIVDLVLVVADSSDEASYVGDLEAAGLFVIIYLIGHFDRSSKVQMSGSSNLEMSCSGPHARHDAVREVEPHPPPAIAVGDG